MNINYSDFEYSHTKDVLAMYSKFVNLDYFKKKTVLEVGCGGGGKSVYIGKKLNPKEVIGIDINDIFLKQARDFSRQKKVDNFVHFYNMSALDTDFNVDKFDIIIMSDVLEHIPDTQKLLEESLRILKPGGIILFDFAPYYHYFGHHIWDTIQIPWIHLFTTEKFRADLYEKSLAGFVDKKQRLNLRLGKDKDFAYLNKITRKQFEKVIDKLKKSSEDNVKIEIHFNMLKNLDFFSKIPILRELFIRHIVGKIEKTKR